MSDKKLTIVKVLAWDGHPTFADLERWRQIFEQHQVTEEQATATGEVEIEHIDLSGDEQTITLVKIGGEDHNPTADELETWRDIFEEAMDDKDFKIFTHPAVEIQVVNIGKIIAID